MHTVVLARAHGNAPKMRVRIPDDRPDNFFKLNCRRVEPPACQRPAAAAMVAFFMALFQCAFCKAFHAGAMASGGMVSISIKSRLRTVGLKFESAP